MITQGGEVREDAKEEGATKQPVSRHSAVDTGHVQGCVERRLGKVSGGKYRLPTVPSLLDMKEYGPKVMHRGARTVNMGRMIFASKHRLKTFKSLVYTHILPARDLEMLLFFPYMHDFRAILLPMHVNE